MSYPPVLSEAASIELLSIATDYALSHTLVYRPPAASSSSKPSTSAVIHAPYALFPALYPRHLFELAQQLQQSYNLLYVLAALDDEFLEEVIGGAVEELDEFQRELFKIWKITQREGLAQSIQLGLFRSDYLIHSPASGSDVEAEELKQVEFNTISSSFGALSSKVTDLHRYLTKSGAYPSNIPELKLENLPLNDALIGLTAGLAAGHRAYGNVNTKILMITQDDERNAFDQRAIEWELLESHNISLVRLPFSQLSSHLSLSSTSALILSLPSTTPIEISVVYYRSGYTPTDYPSPAAWSLRLLIERSKAIKCPTIALQLAGAKKVQQVLAEPGQLERFSAAARTGGLGVNEMKLLKLSFTGLWPMDDSPLGLEADRLVREDPTRFVLKPQREGGGNNIYREDIIPFLDSLDALDQAKSIRGGRKEREAFILMDLIQVKKGVESVMVRAGTGEGVRGEVVSELGIYGVALFEQTKKGEVRILSNETSGHLLRTKGVESDEGGVAVGYSVIDSVCLV